MVMDNSQQSVCDELYGLLPGYMIGAATADEISRVQELLPQCPEAAQHMQDYAAISEGLLDRVAPVAPPPALHDRLMAAVRAEAEAEKLLAADPVAQTPLQPAPPVQPAVQPAARPPPTVLQRPPAPARRSPWWILAAAASALLILTNVYWLSRLSTAEEAISGLLQQQQNIAQVVSQNSLLRISLTDSAVEETPMRAIVLWDGESDQAWLYSDMLPSLPQSQTYQLWLIDGNGATSAGIFQPGANASTLYNFRFSIPLDRYEALGISVEPATGSDAPTTTPIALGSV